MQIKQSDKIPASAGYRRFMKRRYVLAVVVILLVATGYKASLVLRAKGYGGLWDFVSTYVSNYRHGMGAEPESISIIIKDDDMKKLEKKRKQALERGVIINDLDGEYVPATLKYKDREIKVRLRLKGHMTDHLQENKWSFRIKVKDKDSFMGMKRFSIQHPGTRGYIYEWIYHELMRQEGIIALRYSFINVSVNGKDWGIYALEENFDKELIENNHREKGPVIRFNPDLYWVDRYNEMKGMKPQAEFASYYSANPEAYREEIFLKDSAHTDVYLRAIAMVEALRSRKISVDQAFDITRLARFHAIIDLVGGEHSIDWSDIKYYFNPVNSKFEPVAYESFTNLSLRTITGMYRHVKIDSLANYPDWHTMIFSNPVFYAEYIKQLERMSDPAYLDSFFKSAAPELDKNLRIIHKEFPFKRFDAGEYTRRQQMISLILDPPKSLHAYLKKADGNRLAVQVAPIDALPVEVLGISVGTVNSLAPASIVLPSALQNTFVSYKEYEFLMPPGFIWRLEQSDSVMIRYSVLGSPRKKKVKVFSYPHEEYELIAGEQEARKGNTEKFSFLAKKDSIYTFTERNVILTEELVIPANCVLFVPAGTTIDMRNKAGIVSYSPLEFNGDKDAPVVLISSDSSSQGISLVSVDRQSIFQNVIFRELPSVISKGWKRSGSITCYESPVRFTDCHFLNSKARDAVQIVRSRYSFVSCLFAGISGDALNANESFGVLSACVFENCKGDALVLKGGRAGLGDIYMDQVRRSGIKVKGACQVIGENIRVKGGGTALEAVKGMRITIKGIQITDYENGVLASGSLADEQTIIRLENATFQNVGRNYSAEKGISLNINGEAVAGEAGKSTLK